MSATPRNLRNVKTDRVASPILRKTGSPLHGTRETVRRIGRQTYRLTIKYWGEIKFSQIFTCQCHNRRGFPKPRGFENTDDVAKCRENANIIQRAKQIIILVRIIIVWSYMSGKQRNFLIYTTM